MIINIKKKKNEQEKLSIYYKLNNVWDYKRPRHVIIAWLA